jgi:hypothetical protein
MPVLSNDFSTSQSSFLENVRLFDPNPINRRLETTAAEYRCFNQTGFIRTLNSVSSRKIVRPLMSATQIFVKDSFMQTPKRTEIRSWQCAKSLSINFHLRDRPATNKL